MSNGRCRFADINRHDQPLPIGHLSDNCPVCNAEKSQTATLAEPCPGYVWNEFGETHHCPGCGKSPVLTAELESKLYTERSEADLTVRRLEAELARERERAVADRVLIERCRVIVGKLLDGDLEIGYGFDSELVEALRKELEARAAPAEKVCSCGKYSPWVCPECRPAPAPAEVLHEAGRKRLEHAMAVGDAEHAKAEARCVNCNRLMGGDTDRNCVAGGMCYSTSHASAKDEWCSASDRPREQCEGCIRGDHLE